VVGNDVGRPKGVWPEKNAKIPQVAKVNNYPSRFPTVTAYVSLVEYFYQVTTENCDVIYMLVILMTVSCLTTDMGVRHAVKTET
jgi:hypothetical protein